MAGVFFALFARSAGGYAPGRKPAAGHRFPGPAVTLRAQTVDGVGVRVIDANLADPRVYVTVQMATGFPGGAEPFSTLIRRSQPTAAMNGAYFSKEGLTPIGDIVICGQCVYRGDFKTALVITKDRRACVRRHLLGERVEWSDYETVLCCGPALVLDGKIDWEPDARNHQDPHVTGSVPRMGVGITADNHLLFVAASGSLSFARWAHVMKDLGCRDAMNLDSGASRALYYRGSYLAQPGRALTNLLLIYESGQPPNQAVLVPARQVPYGQPRQAQLSRPPAPLPTNEVTANDPNGVIVRICAESGKRASAWCPASVPRRLRRAHVPGPCRLHRPPPGER